MRKTYTLKDRLIAMLLCIAMVAAYLPGMIMNATAAASDNKIVDPYTIHDWKQYFGPDVMSTEYAGGVWTDKSVFKSFADYLTAEGLNGFISPVGNSLSDEVKQMLATDPENFLLALSAITANKSVSGSSSSPLDTVLVLDVSGSMQGNNATAVVQATNEAIETLLKQNTNNRISVVLYSGNHSQGSSNTSTASVLLPLGRYTTTDTMRVDRDKTIPAYLTISGSGNSQKVSVASSVNNGTAADEKTVRGGTYIQNGLYKAWQQFQAVTDTKVPEGHIQAGAQRTPVVILMSDGAPTAATSAYNDVGNSSVGDGTATSNRMAFLTQLTAAWVRSKISTHYNTTPKFYTLGVGTGTSTEATSVLNPAGSNGTLNGYWDRFLAGTNGRDVSIVSGMGGWSVYKDAAVAGKNYVDQYWLANNASGLIDAFQQIVQTIVLQAEQHSTLVEIEQGADMSGYVTFEDELGELIDVKALKGLAIGNMIFTGAEMAKDFNVQNMGTADAPTAYGDEFIRTVKERLGITDTAVAQQLVQNAFLAKQLNYTSPTEFSNYIGWYADEDGNYLGFWQESDGYGAEAAPAGAAYINKSYGYLGAQNSGTSASDMMHVVVMIHTRISDGHQSIVYKIPASLIPAVTYNITLNSNDPSDVKTITRDAAEPMRLLVEVGLRDEINEVNLEQKIAEHIAKGGHVHENADGTYTFYTNRWGDGDGGQVNYDEPLSHLVTESHFHPSLENERYYHVFDDPIYSDANGTVYNGSAAPSGDGYYFAREYYEIVGGTAKQTVKYAPLSPITLEKAVKGNAGWYVPAGTPHQLTRFAANKTTNATNTLAYSWNPVILHDAAGYNSYAFLGNNGSFTIAPAQGIALTKTVTQAVPGAPTEFTFTVTLSQAVANPVITDTEGNALNGVATVNGNVITVKLTADETVVITGIPTGTTYSVKEEETGYYTASYTNSASTVAEHVITNVTVENHPKSYNDLIVSKDVLPPQWMTDVTALENQQFSIRVTIGGADPNTVYATSNSVTFETDAYGTASRVITLKDDESLTVFDLPEGASYIVEEVNVPTGHTANATESAPITGIIPEEGNAIAGVTNTYAPTPAQITLNLAGTKTFLTTGGYTVPDSEWPAEGFVMELYSVDLTTGNATLVKGDILATAANKNWSAAVPLTFDKTGVYNYRIAEKVGNRSDITYDGTEGLFQIIVTDDASGALKISQVVAIQDTAEVTVAGGQYTVDKDFTNYKDAGSVRIPVQKIIQGSTTISVNDFMFGLYDDGGRLMDTVTGNGQFLIAGFGEDFLTAKAYTIREIVPSLENRIVGMTYDDTVYNVSVWWNDAAGILEYALSGNTGNVAVFTNTYTETVSTPAIELGGTKTIAGDRNAFIDGETYTIELYQTGADFRTEGLIPVQGGVVRGNDYDFNFNGLSFKQEGVYYFVVKEAMGNQAGVKYDTSEYHITIHVTKAQNGNATVLTADAVIHKLGSSAIVAADALDFTNTYTVSDNENVTISGIKYLEGRELIGDEFEFGLYEGNVLLQSVKNRSNGTFDFAPITYTAADIGTHTYTVREIIPANKAVGVTYDENTAYTVVVTVADDNLGGLAVTKTVNGNVNTAIEFTNSYKANATSATIAGIKTLYDVDANVNVDLAGGEFTFELYESAEGFAIQGNKLETTNDTDGKFSFTLNYTEAGDHYYILREYIGEEVGMEYDASRYLIRVLVTDDGAGQLHATVTVNHEGQGLTDTIAFGNRYDALPSTVAIAGTKVLEGRQLLDEEFSFELYEGDVLLQTVKNVGNRFAFEAIEYTAAGVYTYTVKEVNPAQTGNVHNGVVYDTTVYTVTVTVVDNNGVLEATVSHTDAQLSFINKLEPEKTPVLSLKKEQAVGTGKAATGKLTVQAGDEVTYILTVTNSGEGEAKNVVVSDKLPKGLILVEDSINENGVYADGTVTWNLETVKAGDSVQLIVKVKVPSVQQDTEWTNIATFAEDGDPTESNEVTLVEKVPPTTPQTGDNFRADLFLGLMVISSFGIAAVMVSKKREQEA
ncbi:MAG: DUF11 domain-containing protein [Oscillospiraceae bacterium]|nr:DUF11 domain-containing protein [Oscillospiraceae bacterium]